MSSISLLVVHSCLLVSAAAAPPPTEKPLVARPYKIRLWLHFADHPRLSPPLRYQVERELPALVEQYMGAAWELEIARPPRGVADR